MGKNKTIRLIAVILALAMAVSCITVLRASAAAIEIFDDEPVPVNKNANQVCKNFYRYLWNVRKSGDLISGAVSDRVIGINGTVADAAHDYHQYIKNYFGVTPVIFGNHLEDYRSYSDSDLNVLAQRYKKGAIPMFQFGVGNSSLLGDVDARKNGIVHYDESNPDRNEEVYQSYVDDREKLGEFCKRLEASGVEVYIIRLYIEHNNSSKHGFYGTDYRGYNSFKNAWKNIVKYLTDEVKITGALFAYSPCGFRTSESNYPGAQWVDLNSPTVYSNSSDGEISMSTDCVDYEWMRYEKRPFGFSELAARGVFGSNITRPIGDYADTMDSLLYAFPELSFFVLWYEEPFSIGPNTGSASSGNYNGEYFIKNPHVIVAENAINYKTSTPIESNGIATLYKKGDKKGSPLNFGKFTAKELKQKGIDLSKTDSLDVLFGCAVAVYETADFTGNAKIYTGKSKGVNNIFSKAGSISIIKLENVALQKNISTDDSDDRNIFKLNDGKNGRFDTLTKNSDGTMDITIDLGKEYVIGQASLNLAGFYEDNIYNIRDFAFYVSNDDNTYKMVYKRIANKNSAANFYFDAVRARYVRLHIITPNNSQSAVEKQRVSLAEILVYGTDSLKINNSVSVEKESGKSYSGYRGNTTDYKFDDVVDDITPEVEKTEQKAPKLPEYIIPAIYKYIWLFISGGLLLLAGGFWLFILLISRKRKNNQ